MFSLGLVEDDHNIATTLRIGLEPFGFKTEVYPSAESFLSEGLSKAHHLLVIDLNLPKMGGIALCGKIRERFLSLPIIVLTAQLDEKTAVQSLQAGADDFIRKPFGLLELKTRVEKLIAKAGADRAAFKFNGLVLDKSSMRCSFEGRDLNLTPSEFTILSIFMTAPDQAFTRESIIHRLDPEGLVHDRILDSHISRIRQKLRQVGCNSIKISSIYGTGYRIFYE
ncbi:MAG: response regulator transcription factor [Oligoflexia bacterium]|nr:response regulator transcription factor [Oligoflexia bacterium]